ncbi:MAG: dethiobiotin synthase [Planctomycetota bacterium]
MIVLVSGSDTGVGKTRVTAALARALVALGRRVVAVKPVESGWSADVAGDGECLAAATGQSAPGRALQVLATPVAPTLAAEREGVTLDPATWVARIREFEREAEVVLVEGAGGLLSPLAPGLDARDLARTLGASVLLVVANRLGAVHQARAVVELARVADLELAGLVLSSVDPDDLAAPDNARLLEAAGLGVPVDRLPHGAGEAPSALEALATRLLAGRAGARDAAAWTEWLASRAAARREISGGRRLEATRRESAGRVVRGGETLLSFAGNDYLDLAAHPRVVAAAREALDDGGWGERSAALVTGHSEDHAALGEELAAFVGAEDALLFASGWAANAGLLGALGGPDLALFSDEFVHASLVDGARLARSRGASLRVFPHGDLDALELALAGATRPRRLVLAESVFSMDGDLADLDGLLAICVRHGARLLLDEAHAFLLLGPGGAGLADGVSHPDLIRVVTFGKALGVAGAAVLADRSTIEELRHAARSFVFSTGLPRPVAASARAALAVARTEPERRARLTARRAEAAALFSRPVPAAILPLVVGDSARALDLSRRLRDEGLLVPAIRPPTVPPGTARLRVVLGAAHEAADLERLARALL